MNKLIIKETPLKKLKIIKHILNKDKRGFLGRLYCYETLKKLLKKKTIKQINRSMTKKKGTVRGLHFQYSPYSEIKIISCIKGKVWDVAVDLRKGSPTFLNYHAELLTEDNHKSYLIPEGFAHGFQSITPNCELLYLHTENYNKNFEGAVNATDPIINIQWPHPIKERSERDKKQPMLNHSFKGLVTS